MLRGVKTHRQQPILIHAFLQSYYDVRPTLSNDINSTTAKDASKSGAQSAAVLPVIALVLAFVASFNSVFGSIYTEYLFKNTPGLSFGQQQVSILP
jgi:hypothetical protein